MEIIRDGKTYTLTHEEVAKAHEEFVTSFMEGELMNSFGLDETTAKDVAADAYGLYCKGNGETQYECIEWAYNQYEKSKSHWSEVRNNFVDDNNICHIDAWETSDDSEEGTEIAYVDMNNGKVIYAHPFALKNDLAQEAIREAIEMAKEECSNPEEFLSQKTPMDFIRELWSEFGDIPMDPETENLEED